MMYFKIKIKSLSQPSRGINRDALSMAHASLNVAKSRRCVSVTAVKCLRVFSLLLDLSHIDQFKPVKRE